MRVIIWEEEIRPRLWVNLIDMYVLNGCWGIEFEFKNKNLYYRPCFGENNKFLRKILKITKEPPCKDEYLLNYKHDYPKVMNSAEFTDTEIPFSDVWEIIKQARKEAKRRIKERITQLPFGGF